MRYSENFRNSSRLSLLFCRTVITYNILFSFLSVISIYQRIFHKTILTCLVLLTISFIFPFILLFVSLAPFLTAINLSFILVPVVFSIRFTFASLFFKLFPFCFCFSTSSGNKYSPFFK